MSRRSAYVRAFGRSSPVNPPPFSVSSCIGIKSRFSIILRWTILLYVQGYTRATMDGTKRSKPARGSQSQKTVLSSDCRLQLACMKLESLVMADQHAAVNTFPGLVH